MRNTFTIFITLFSVYFTAAQFVTEIRPDGDDGKMKVATILV